MRLNFIRLKNRLGVHLKKSQRQRELVTQAGNVNRLAQRFCGGGFKLEFKRGTPGIFQTAGGPYAKGP